MGYDPRIIGGHFIVAVCWGERMADSVYWFFVKFFEKEEYIDEFRKGRLYMNRLSYFRDLESEEGTRGDKAEGTAGVYQPQNVILTLSPHGEPPIVIDKSDLAGPVTIAFNNIFRQHVFCLYA